MFDDPADSGVLPHHFSSEQEGTSMSTNQRKLMFDSEMNAPAHISDGHGLIHP